jgi:hypothetical protein
MAKGIILPLCKAAGNLDLRADLQQRRASLAATHAIFGMRARYTV